MKGIIFVRRVRDEYTSNKSYRIKKFLRVNQIINQIFEGLEVDLIFHPFIPDRSNQSLISFILQRMCVQPAHYQDWLAFKRYSIESVERGECREHRYHHNIENCARWQPYSPYKQAEADTGSFTDNRNDNNYNDKNASYFSMPNVLLILVIVSLKMLY